MSRGYSIIPLLWGTSELEQTKQCTQPEKRALFSQFFKKLFIFRKAFLGEAGSSESQGKRECQQRSSQRRKVRHVLFSSGLCRVGCGCPASSGTARSPRAIVSLHAVAVTFLSAGAESSSPCNQL